MRDLISLTLFTLIVAHACRLATITKLQLLALSQQYNEPYDQDMQTRGNRNLPNRSLSWLREESTFAAAQVGWLSNNGQCCCMTEGECMPWKVQH